MFIQFLYWSQLCQRLYFVFIHRIDQGLVNDLLEVFKSLLCLNLNTEMYDEIMVKRSPALRLKGMLIMYV